VTSPETSSAGPGADDATVTRQQWKWSVLAGMASYLDAGSIVALSAGLSLFQTKLHLSSAGVGALAALGPNALGCAIGAFIGGRLGDKLGRKTIYKWDLLVYALGILCIALSVNGAMLFIGTFVVGVAVGTDVPTSLALVGEFAPSRARGKLVGLTQVAWNTGPLIVLLLSLALSSLGLTGIRIVFLQLFVVAIVTWALRQGLAESARWRTAVAEPGSVRTKVAALFNGANLRALLFTGIVYTFWNLAAGTNGAFTPYIVKTLHAGSQAASVGLSAFNFSVAIIVTILVYMRFNDRSFHSRKLMWGVGAAMQILAFAAYLVLPFTIPVIILNLLLFGMGGAMAGEAFYKTWSQELFPTLLRGTAQGFTFGVARFLLALWSFLVPVLAQGGITPVAAVLTTFLLISGVVGYFGMPDTAGKSLEQIETERTGSAQVPETA
jgi:MFS transporter, SP family, inositol transporter